MEYIKNKSTGMQLLQTQLDVMNAKNEGLSKENALLRHKLNRLNGTMDIESKFRCQKLEDERDDMNENLEKMKKKYNKLHKVYLGKVEHCKALENMLKEQKAPDGFDIKLGFKPQHQYRAQNVGAAKNFASENTNIKSLEAHTTKLQTALDKAYEKIDELEFELETLEYLQQENHRMQKELKNLKSSEYTEPDGDIEDEAPPRNGPIMAPSKNFSNRIRQRQEVTTSVHSYESFSFFTDDDEAGSEIMELSTSKNSQVKNTETDTNCLRSESLRTKIRPKNIVRLSKYEQIHKACQPQSIFGIKNRVN